MILPVIVLSATPRSTWGMFMTESPRVPGL